MSDDTERDTTVETQRNLNESVDKIRLSAKVTRGTGTRDQEKFTVKARGDDPDEAAANLDETIAALEERGTFDRLRNLQPEVSDGDE